MKATKDGQPYCLENRGQKTSWHGSTNWPAPCDDIIELCDDVIRAEATPCLFYNKTDKGRSERDLRSCKVT